jgi:2-polyprenyl-6-hydroxyphenyl methylase/3-demethylubiquinone-9 3-methyltransferase
LIDSVSTTAHQPPDIRDRALFYEHYAGDFDRRMNRYEVGKRLRLIFDDVLGGEDLSGRALLDAGCGTGLFSRAAAERGAAVTSMDVGERLLAEVAKKCDTTRVVGDVAAMPFSDGSFDVVICTEVIEHTVEPRAAVRELARVVRPGGLLVVTTPNHAWHFAITIANALRLRPYEGLENWVRWRDLPAWLRQEGLEVREQRGFNALPFVHPVTYRPITWLDRFGHTLGRWMINMLAVARRP